jgi:hypothetical protein
VKWPSSRTTRRRAHPVPIGVPRPRDHLGAHHPGDVLRFQAQVLELGAVRPITTPGPVHRSGWTPCGRCSRPGRGRAGVRCRRAGSAGARETASSRRRWHRPGWRRRRPHTEHAHRVPPPLISRLLSSSAARTFVSSYLAWPSDQMLSRREGPKLTPGHGTRETAHRGIGFYICVVRSLRSVLSCALPIGGTAGSRAGSLPPSADGRQLGY